jgi:hypothetical protein
MNAIHSFASKLTGARVDFDKRIIYGIVVMTVGRAFGHCSVDATTLQQFMAATGNGAEKIRGRENHPDEVNGESGITKKVQDLRGYFFNLRIDGEKLLADFQAYSEDAAGKEPTQLLFKAHEAPEIFGVSPVFFGKPEKDMARVSKVVAIDFVDIPAGDDANQQLFKGVSKMAALMAEEREGKFFVKCGAEEYEVGFPPKKEEEKKEMDADGDKDAEAAKAKLAAEDEEKKKAELAAEESDADATKKDLTKAGAKKFSAADMAEAEVESRAKGKKDAIKYAADFDGVMDAAGIKGDARDNFRKNYFAKGETFGLDYVKDLAKAALSARTQALGEGSGGGADSEVKTAAVNRFKAFGYVREAWGCKTTDENSDEWKKSLASYSASLAKTEAQIAASKK